LDNYDDFFRVFDEVVLNQTATIQQKLKKLKDKTEVVWIIPDPVKDFIVYNSSELI